MINFESGKHLTNYILKIFKNDNIVVPENDIFEIKKLSNVHNFISNLPKSILSNLSFDKKYINWINLAQHGKYKELSDIAKISNDNINKFSNDPKSISFDRVFKSFNLGIEYSKLYLQNKSNIKDIYYPHFFEVLEGSHRYLTWNISYYDKPNINKEDIMGCYFIYDNNGDVVYIGKSNCNLFERSCTSAQERTKGNFSKIELYPMPTHADTNIYEIYFIATYHPKYNSDSCYPDKPTFKLPELHPKYIIARVGVEQYNVEQIYPNVTYISSEKYWENPGNYFLSPDNGTINFESFYKFYTNNKNGFINDLEFKNKVKKIRDNGYLVFVSNNKTSCFRQFA